MIWRIQRWVFGLSMGLLAVFAPLLAFAQGIVPCGGSGQPACNLCTFYELLANLNNILVGIGISITTAVFVWGGVLMMTAAGSEERFKKGKANLRAGLIGMIIVLLSWVVIGTVINLLSPQASGVPGDWWAQAPNCP